MFGPSAYKNAVNNKNGFLMVITGPMGSGKTTELFRQLERVEIAKKKTMLFKPAKDDRDDGVRTHAGFSRKAIPVEKSEDILKLLEDDASVVAIEEAQFFNDDICAVSRVLVARGINVIITGLDLDSNGAPFGPMPLLLAHAEYVVKLQAVCVYCGADASKTKRKSSKKGQILVGGMDIYEPVCTRCHVK